MLRVRSDALALRPQCHIAQVPNEILAKIFSCLPLDKPFFIRKLRQDLERPRYRNVRVPQIIILSWVSRQFRQTVHEHSFWHDERFDFGTFIAAGYLRPRPDDDAAAAQWDVEYQRTVGTILPKWLADSHFRTCLERKSAWRFTDSFVFLDLLAALPNLNPTRLSLGTDRREITLSASFKSLPLCPNVTFLEIWPFEDDPEKVDLTVIRLSFPNLKTLHISEPDGYTGNVHDIVGLTEFILHSEIINGQLIPYGSSETLTRLGFHNTGFNCRRYEFTTKGEPQLTSFNNIHTLELFPIHTKLKNLLMPMPSKPTCLHASIHSRDELDHYLFSAPCFQHVRQLHLFYELAEWLHWSPERGGPFFESVIQQITSLRLLEKVRLGLGFFDPAWLRYFRNLRELRELICRPWKIIRLGDMGDGQELLDKYVERMISQLRGQTCFEVTPTVMIEADDGTNLILSADVKLWMGE